MTKFVTFGETMGQYNAQFIGGYDPNGSYMLDCAGAESNVAADIQRLGVPDLEVVWISRVGDDEAGRFVLSELSGRIGVSAAAFAGEKTGISYLNHHADGQHIKTYFRKGSAASRLTFDEVEPHLSEADVLHVTGITPALSSDCRTTTFAALDYASANGIPVSFDLNYREQLWTPSQARDVFEHMMPYSSIFKAGHDEAEVIWGRGWDAEEYARHFQRLNGGVAVITRADNGAVAFDGASLVMHEGYRVEVIDPVGAGDAFVAGLMASILKRCDLRSFLSAGDAQSAEILNHALDVANVCGALTCTRHGDTAAMPSRQEVQQFIAGSR